MCMKWHCNTLILFCCSFRKAMDPTSSEFHVRIRITALVWLNAEIRSWEGKKTDVIV